VTAGLLIVNADDWGMNARTTDAILACFERGAVTSASAMVYMADSGRAAEIGRERRLPLGLHLNLIRPYTDPDATTAVRERQRRLVAYLSAGRWRRWVPNPFLQAEVRRCVDDQCRRFRELYGREPTHVDGEQHVHTWPNALLALPAGAKVRLTFAFAPGEKPAWNRAVRGALNALIKRRFATTACLVSIRQLDPRFGGGGLQERLAVARRAPLEVMAHAGDDDERAYLLSDDWQQAIRGCPLGSYEDLNG
jgi:chitin disaccharide deacetylase